MNSTLAERFEALTTVVVDIAWGLPLVILLVGTGLVLTLYSRLLPFRHFGHAFRVLRGDFDDAGDPGQINHFQALSTALAATIGVGNIGGVAIAITQGGAGAVFWMWVAAFVGMATKFFTCTLAVLYRGRDSKGTMVGGPMYTIENGLGRRYKPLALAFATFGLVGCLPMFQANQLAEILNNAYHVPATATGAVCVLLVAAVAFGGVERIGTLTGRMVPAMCLLYLVLAVLVMVFNSDQLVSVFSQIFTEAFTGRAAIGGAEGLAVREVILIGVRRAAFSNEAGIGTAPMAHGAARTDEPVREGMVAMLGPFIDTILVCSLTAFVILSSADWQTSDVAGVSLTNAAMVENFGGLGQALLTLVVVMFGLSTMISYSYYGKKCFSYLFGAEIEWIYGVLYLVGIFFGSIWTARTVVNIVDSAFAMMAVPNLLATLLLAPAVMKATRKYLAKPRQA
jgi:AGCS family alanine or glycine:cation symporter